MANLYTKRLREIGVEGGGRLGRHVQHDPRSKRFAYNTSGIQITPIRHARNVPIFNQGDLGSCTGNAAVGCMATDPNYRQLGAGTPVLDEGLAVKVYTLATTLDDDPDSYPPNDTGSTGLAACKALQKLGLIGGYQHTFNLGDALKALTIQPVMIGINWYSSFDEPDAHGLVKIAKGAQIRGGHEVYLDEITPSGVGGPNSWGIEWGLQGRFYMAFSTFDRLMGEDGDVTVPITGGITGPTGPSGPSGATGPVATPDDVEAWAAMRRWATKKGLT